MSPATTPADIDAHTNLFACAARELDGRHVEW